MGEVIGSKAEVGRIEEHVRRTLRVALARGGDVGKAAQDWLAPAVAAIDSAVGRRQAADDAEAEAWAPVLAEDAKSDLAIGRIRDLMWNMLGRPRQSAFLEHVFPGGVTTYTSGDPRQQPVLMEMLRSRLADASAPQWPREQCEAWAAEIDALRQSYLAAVEAHRPTEAAATIANAGYRSAVRMAHARLVSYKRDLMNRGLTEAQIHEIIPDVATRAAASPAAPPEAGNDNGGPGQVVSPKPAA